MAERRRLISSKENSPPSSPFPQGSSQRSVQKTAVVSEKIAAMRDHWSWKKTSDAGAEFAKSPTLAQLQRESAASAKKERQGPKSSVMLARQRELERLHHGAKSRLAGVGGVGGGVSLWPAMDDMRLSRGDAAQLAFLCLFLILSTAVIFLLLHGTHLEQLRGYYSALSQFSASHPLHTDRGQEIFNQDILQWHTHLLSFQSEVRNDFNVVWSEASSSYIFSTVLYISGVAVLLYFLAENVFSKSRLTPRRIKIWVCLMCVVGVWSVMSTGLLLSAQKLEDEMESAILSLIDQLAGLVASSLDLTRYRDVLLYWETGYLRPHSRGLLSLLGLLPVRDVSFYLHYYSLPVLTAVCTPIIKLIISLRAVYKQ